MGRMDVSRRLVALIIGSQAAQRRLPLKKEYNSYSPDTLGNALPAISAQDRLHNSLVTCPSSLALFQCVIA